MLCCKMKPLVASASVSIWRIALMTTKRDEAGAYADAGAINSNIEFDLYADLMDFIGLSSPAASDSTPNTAAGLEFDLDWLLEGENCPQAALMVVCPACGSQSASHDLFCIECGTFLD
jgi:hypothetical protein